MVALDEPMHAGVLALDARVRGDEAHARTAGEWAMVMGNRPG